MARGGKDKEGKKASRFPRGTQIEVLSTEEGFNGAWYRAQILDDLDTHCLVQYVDFDVATEKEGEEEEEKLKEVVERCRVRPRPPLVDLKRAYVAGEGVEAWDNHGWWMGKVVARLDHNNYAVHFELLRRIENHPACNLRPLQEFRDGAWLHHKKISTSIRDLVNTLINNGKDVRGMQSEWCGTVPQDAKYRPCMTNVGAKASSLSFPDKPCNITQFQEERVELISHKRQRTRTRNRHLAMIYSAVCSIPQAARCRPCIRKGGAKASSLSFPTQPCKITQSQQEKAELVSYKRPRTRTRNRQLGMIYSAVCSTDVMASSKNDKTVSCKFNADFAPLIERESRQVAESGNKPGRIKSRVNDNSVVSNTLVEYLDTTLATIATVTNSDGSFGSLDEAAVKRLQLFSYQLVVLTFHRQGALNPAEKELLEKLRQHLAISNDTNSLILKYLRNK